MECIFERDEVKKWWSEEVEKWWSKEVMTMNKNTCYYPLFEIIVLVFFYSLLVSVEVKK